MQTSHGLQSLKHDGTGVHGLQREVSVTLVRSQLPAPFTTEPIQAKLPLPGVSSQQPKQSQPFGVSGRQ